MKKKGQIETDIVLDEDYTASCLVERLRTKINWSMPNSHKHNVHEFYYLLSGHVYYVIDYTVYSVNPGDIVIIPKGVRHRTLHGTQNDCDRLLVYFSDAFSAAAGMLSNAADTFLKPGVITISPKKRERVQQIFDALQSECSSEDKNAPLAVAQLFFELMLLISRHGDATPCEKTDTMETRIEEAVRYIHENYAQPITLSDLARLACVERTYFSKVFKRVTGLNFQDYLAEVRLEKAVDMLLTSPLSVGEIALNCGFMNINYFGDFFKKHTGLSPNKYRKNKETHRDTTAY